MSSDSPRDSVSPDPDADFPPSDLSIDGGESTNRSDYPDPSNPNGPSGGPSASASQRSVGEAVGDMLPVFASSENRALDAAVKAKERFLQAQLDELEENRERVAIMQEHLKNVEREQQNTQLLIDEREKEKQTENHLKSLANREAGRVENDLKRVEAELNEIIDSYNSVSNAKFLASEKIESYKRRMNWNQEELLQWALAAKQKEEDANQLEFYHLQDSKAIKTLMMKYEAVARQLQAKKTELENEMTETRAVQIELDKTADAYKRVHQEKQQLIQQWNECKEALYRKDEDITELSEEIVKNKSIIKQLESQVKEQENLLTQEVNNNRALNVKTGNEERANEKKRSELFNLKNELLAFEDQVQNLRGQLEKADQELKASRRNVVNVAAMKQAKLQQFEDIKKQVEETRETLEKEKSNTLTMQERNAQIDQLYKANQQQLNFLNNEINKLKDSMFKLSQQLFQERTQEANLIAEISGAQGKSRNSQDRIHRLDQDSLKQQEMLYNIEFQVQQLERKVSHASGKRSIEDTQHLNKQIEVLQNELEAQNRQYQLINQQMKRLNDDLRTAKRQHNSILETKEDLKEQIHRIEMENESLERDIRIDSQQRQELIVSHDLLKLEVKKLRDALNERADAVLAQEQRKYTLQLALKEREKEISLREDIRRAELKSLEESHHQLVMDLKERLQKVEKLKKKYETVAAKLHSQEELSGVEEPRSQAYYIIKAAQEREELQRIGDSLNAEIKAAEKEIHALQNTHELLQQRNQTFKAGLAKIDPNAPEAREKAQLEEQQRAAIDKLYKQRAYLREILTDFEERRSALASLVNSIGGAQQEIAMRESEAAALQKALNDQLQSLQRSERVKIAKLKEYRKACGLPPLSDAELDEYENDLKSQSEEELHMKLQEKKRRNRVIMQILQEYIMQNPIVARELESSLKSLGIELPSDSRPQSAASSVSSVHSVRSYSGSMRPPPRMEEKSKEEKRPSSRPTSSGSTTSLPPINQRASSSSRPLSNSSSRSSTARDRPLSGRNTGIDLSIDARRK